MIVGSSLTIEIGDRALVRDASFVVGSGEKVALVGRNGTGKSSFVSVVIGEAPPHLRATGNVRVTGTLGHLPQVPPPRGLGLDPSGFSHVLSSRGLDVLDDALDQARKMMAKDPTGENIALFSDLEEQYRENGGYEAESVMARLADGLGLRQELLFDDIDRLSGGQRRRVDLIRVLFQAPDIMVLDEPTNHLDLAAKRWLMDELAGFGGSLLLISHDLKLLDHSIAKVLHLAEGRLAEFKGNYSSFRVQLAQDQSQRERASELEGQEIRRLKTLADSMRGQTEKRARKAKVLDKRVDRLQGQRTEVHRRERQRAFKLPVPRRSGEVPVEVRGLAVRYGAKPVLTDVSFHLVRGDRMVVIGRNGAGKSSLLRCLAGVQAPSAGTITLGANVVRGYFAQEHEQVDLSLSTLGNIDDSVLKTEAERRALLGSFGLPGKAAAQMPASLSGGERAKLGLAMLSAGWSNVLILDEPTNNLDPASIEAVGRMLSQWPGTLVVVSHDRAFVEALEPSHALALPEERYDYWREENLDHVETR
jgi:ATPase subunit of ABC transporter with duplicated ATPase domains